MLTAKLVKTTSAKEVLEILGPQLNGDLVEHIQMSAASTRLARNKRTFDQNLQHSSAVTRLVAGVFDFGERGKVPGREGANVLWAVATLGSAGQCTRDLVPVLVRGLAIQASTLNPQEVANIIWAVGTLQLADAQLRTLLPKVCSQLLEHLDEYSEQNVANIIWSTARLKGRSLELLEIHEVLAQMAVDRRTSMLPQQLSNIIWAGATLKDEAPYLLELLPRFLEDMRRVRQSFNAQDVANTVWAVATLEAKVPLLQELLPDLLHEVPRVADKLKPQEVANILWAGATLRKRHLELWRPVVPALTKILCQTLHFVKGQEIANSMWGLVFLDAGSKQALETMQKLAQSAVTMSGRMTPQDVGTICYALALRGICCTPFLDAASSTVRANAKHWPLRTKCFDLP